MSKEIPRCGHRLAADGGTSRPRRPRAAVRISGTTGASSICDEACTLADGCCDVTRGRLEPPRIGTWGPDVAMCSAFHRPRHTNVTTGDRFAERLHRVR